VADLLGERGRGSERETGGRHTFLATDGPDSFRAVGSRFLGRSIDHVELVDIAP
jgi:hypothetical protein